jgi:5-formyltetrahydrofolate cyclo-ligase
VANTDADKKRARLEARERLESLSLQEKRDKSLQILNHLNEFLVSRNLSTAVLGVYAPIQNEVDWNLARAQGADFQNPIAFPAFRAGSSLMSFHRCTFEELESSNEFGVELKTPPQSSQVCEPEVLLIPGLAFGQKGQRLGRGKAFYDRYLQNHQCLKIGISYETQIVEDLPVAVHDQGMDVLISESGYAGREFDLG